jgi:enoyl-CoA hydratase/carnithine racemase
LVDLDEIAYDKAQGVAQITLNRPAQLNPISARVGGTRDQIEWALADAAADSSIGAVMLRGAGKAFSGGGDLTGNARRETALEQALFMEQAEKFHRAVRSSPLPVVAAVHGYCLGAAVNLVACCDMVIAAEGARFGVPEGRIGLIGASPLVPLVGRQWAKFMILTGELLTAIQARDIGLVLSVEPDDEVMDRVTDLCQRLARLPREAAQLNKRTIDAIADASGDAAARLTGAAMDAVTLTNSPRATAPDGRTFREIIDREGMQGMKKARAEQYDTPWLR